MPSSESIRVCSRGCRSIRGAAEFLGVSKSQIWQMVRDGTFSSFRFGRLRLIPVVELVNYLAELRDSQRELVR